MELLDQIENSNDELAVKLQHHLEKMLPGLFSERQQNEAGAGVPFEDLPQSFPVDLDSWIDMNDGDDNEDKTGQCFFMSESNAVH